MITLNIILILSYNYLVIFNITACVTLQLRDLGNLQYQPVMAGVLLPRAPWDEKRQLCACALVKTSVKMRGNCWRVIIHCAMVLPVAAIRCEKVELSSTLCNASRIGSTHVTLCNSPTARQVAERITQCNSAFNCLNLQAISIFCPAPFPPMNLHCLVNPNVLFACIIYEK